MTTCLRLSDAICDVQRHHPHWHIWRTDTLVWGTRCRSACGGSGTTLDAPTPERLNQVLAEFEHKHGWAA